MGNGSTINPSGPINVVILVVNLIHSVYAPLLLCKGNVQHFIYGEFDASDFVQLVLMDDLEIVLY